MTRSARRALSALTALVMVGTLFIGALDPAYANGSDTYYVAQSGDAAQEETPARKGTSCADPDFVGGDQTPIVAAATSATDGDTIYICAGAGPYLIESTISLGAELLTLQGAGAGATILDGGGNTQILTSSGAITVSNLTFQNGRNGSFGGNGGAINAVTVTVTSSRFKGNFAFTGGAISASTVTVTSSRFKGNIASLGGAISASTVTVTSSRFIGNAASTGGAIYADTTATVTRSTFTSNTATNRGGAIDATTGTIARSRFIRNTAGDHGGAVALFSPNSGDLQKLRGNTFMRNRAGAGAAIMLGSCEPAFSRSQAARVERANSFSGNRATEKRRTNNIERWTDACG